MVEQTDPRLKLRLIASDATVLAFVWTAIMWFGPHSMQRSKLRSLGLVVLAVIVACIAIRQAGLLLYRRCAVRATEMRLLLWVTTFTVSFMLLFDRIVLSTTGLRFYVLEAFWGAVLMMIVLTAERSVWRAVLRASRQAGRRERRVLVLGTSSDAKRLVELFRAHPEQGLRVIGVVGSRAEAERNALAHLWLGTVGDVEQIVVAQSLSGVVVAAPTEHPFIDELMRTLLAMGVHVHLSTGVAGMDMSRFRYLPVAREPLLYVERRNLGPLELAAKRTLDIAGSIVILAAMAPVMIAIALGVKLADRGPVFYLQERGGRGGRRFRVVKFRTMVPNADKRLAEVAHLNTREGVLFKADDDPRVTKLGKVLRLSSLDELPQLFNVLTGSMSIVGPRPPLPNEAATYNEREARRLLVKPGLTGLWQVEGRSDLPWSDGVYLDLLYVDHWSPLLDLVIIARTVRAVVKPDGAY
jgi:exopolysaccharide biosynthesis polyprenyl glycosylphosphotransferase